MNYHYHESRPKDVITSCVNIVVNFHIEEITKYMREESSEIPESAAYRSEQVVIQGGAIGSTFSYEHLVTAIIRTRYSSDAMEAALFNQRPEELQEINDFRNEAKSIARTIFGNEE